jgi:glycosyltransferase involved in cell wall biosynthesis
MPKISAIVATRDRPAMVVEAIASIQAQTRPVDEIVVADDGDGTTARDLAERFGVKTVHTGGIGPAGARNAAVAASTGEWLAFCDDDDRWWPRRLETQCAAVAENTVLVYADALRSDGLHEFLNRNPSAGYVFGSLLLDNWLPTSTVLLRRDAFEQAGGFSPRHEPAEDYGLWLAVSRVGPFVRLDEPLADYRIHPDQLQNRIAAMAGATADVVEEALAEIGWRPTQIPDLAHRLRRLRFVQGRAFAAGGDMHAARRAYGRAWRVQPAYLKAPLFYLLSWFGR